MGESSVLHDRRFDMYEFNELKKTGDIRLRSVAGIWATIRNIMRDTHTPVALPLVRPKTTSSTKS